MITKKELSNRIWLGFFPTSNTLSNSVFRPCSWPNKPRTESENQNRFCKYLRNPAFLAQNWRHGCTNSTEISWKKDQTLPLIVVSSFERSWAPRVSDLQERIAHQISHETPLCPMLQADIKKTTGCKYFSKILSIQCCSARKTGAQILFKHRPYREDLKDN